MATVNQAKEVFLTPPLSIAGCALWLDAADPSTITGTASVTKVNDKSGNSVNLSNASGYSYPNNTFNGTYPSFFSTNGAASASAANLGYNAAFALTMPFSLFFVGIQTNTGTFGYLCDAAPASGGVNRIYTYTPSLTFSTPFGGGVAASTTNFITDILYVAGTSASSVFVNGSSYVTGTVGQFTCSGITVANRFSLNEGFPGHICEVLAFNAGVTTIQRQQIEGYLAWKWGLQSSLVSGHPFSSSSPYQTSKVPYSIGNAVKATLFGQYVFSSTTIAGCQLWMDAADSTTITRSGANITGWNDKANLYTGTATNSPQYNSNPINRLPTIRFDGASSRYVLISANNYNYSTMTYFMVIRWISGSGGFMGTDTPGNYGRALAVSSPNTQLLLYNQFYTTSVALTAGQPCILSAYFNGTADFTVILNGVKTLFSVAQATGNTNTNGFNIGVFNPTNGGNHSFDMGEGLVYNSILTDTQREQVEGYLAWKWGIQTSLLTTHPYYTNSPIYIFPISVTKATTQIWSPLKVAGCQLWLDAADRNSMTLSGQNITQWQDKSQSLAFTSSPTSPTLTTAAFNGQNCINFNLASSTYLLNTTFSYNIQNRTIFFVFQASESDTGNTGILSFSSSGQSDFNSSNTMIIATGFPIGGVGGNYGPIYIDAFNVTIQLAPTNLRAPFGIYCEQNVSNSGTLFVNGNQPTLYNLGTATAVGTSYATPNLVASTGLIIGARFQAFLGSTPNAFCSMNLAEVICFSPSLSQTQRQQVEGYLAWKWGLRGSLPGGHPYINFPPSP